MGDNLVEAFTVFIRKHKESAKQYSQQQSLASLAKVQNSLKHVGSLLQLFVDDTIDDQKVFGVHTTQGIQTDFQRGCQSGKQAV
jgi:hypothetical protein